MNRNFSFLFLFCLLSIPAILIGKNKSETISQETISINRKLVNPDSSPEAKAVYKYLQDMFGEKILSGQMWAPWGIDELEYIKNVTGKQPAIRGIDFIHEASNNMETQNAIDWWKAGGIPTIMWHWGAPSIGEGYENSKKEIDIKKCFINGTPENEAMWAELKLKADHLETLRDANVPVLWRPFHELNGDWFWWSKQGPDLFKQLWITMYDYYVNERKLNNLVWVFCYTSNPEEIWYPGDKYVDIIAADTYVKNSEPQEKMFTKSSEIAGNEWMPVAFHECGTIPDPDECLKEDVMWSWWMEWHTSHLTEMDKNYLSYVYNHDLVITLDEIPDIMKEYGENIFQRKFKSGRIIPSFELKSFKIGTKSKSGEITGNNSLIEIKANGADISGKKDEGYFAFNQYEGDFDISVQVQSLSLADSYTKAGIMARVDLSGSSKHVYFHVFPNNNPKNKNFGGCEFQYRGNKSDESVSIYPELEASGNQFNVNFPNTWIRLTRNGDIFRSYISSDNENWHLYSKHKQKMPAKILLGLAVTSRNSEIFTEAKFSNLQLTW